MHRSETPKVEELLPTFPVFVFVFVLLFPLVFGDGGRGVGGMGQRRAFLLQLCRHLPGKTLRDKLAAMIRHAHQ